VPGSRADVQPAAAGDVRQGRDRRGLLAGWLASGVLHAIALLIAAVIIIERPSGPPGNTSVSVELALAPPDEVAGQDQVMPDLEPSPIDLDLQEMPEIETDLELEDSLDDAIDAFSLEDLESLSNAGTEGDAGSLAGSGGAAASFFGVRARGSRFAYIVDISGSMKGRKWAEARQALEQSVDDLPTYTSFVVVLFNRETLLPPSLVKPKWWASDVDHKSDLRRWLRGVTPSGPTEPVDSFERILGMKPRPDVIYFLTDGDFDDRSPERIAILNRQGPPVVINTIAFVSEEGAHLLRQIADESNGTYRFVPGEGP
jgi:hypothetical protein